MKGHRWRVRLLLAPFLLIALVLVAKLYFLQILRGEAYAAQANRQAVRPQAGLFDRGSIYFTTRTGEPIAAATLASGFTLAVKPTEVENPEALYQSLSAVFAIDKTTFIAKAGKAGDPYEELARRLSKDEADRIRALKLPGIVIEDAQWRAYPAETIAAQAIGFVAYDGDVLRGRYGLERYYDDALSREGAGLYVNLFAEIFSAAREVLGARENAKGDLITTIEPTVQATLERELTRVNETWSPRELGGIIMDPMTGEIVAMAVHPSFDLNEFGAADPGWYANPMVENVYEMGSIIKPLTMAAGLDSRAVTAATTYNDRGFLEVDSKTIRNFDGKGRGVVPMQEVLNQSLNTGVSFVVDSMGIEKFTDYMRAFGIGEETGIDLPGELPGLVSGFDSNRKIEHYTASFGQGIAITPISTIRALAALGNGGTLVTPHMVRAIRHETGAVRTIGYPEGNRVIAKETSHEISRMLTEVVDTALADGKIKLEHTSVAAKTGTAQIANPGGGGYYDDRYLHTFFGYFPSYEPKFIVFLFALEPKGANFASQTLTDPFHRLTTFLINYYEIAPDR